MKIVRTDFENFILYLFLQGIDAIRIQYIANLFFDYIYNENMIYQIVANKLKQFDTLNDYLKDEIMTRLNSKPKTGLFKNIKKTEFEFIDEVLDKLNEQAKQLFENLKKQTSPYAATTYLNFVNMIVKLKKERESFLESYNINKEIVIQELNNFIDDYFFQISETIVNIIADMIEDKSLRNKILEKIKMSFESIYGDFKTKIKETSNRILQLPARKD